MRGDALDALDARLAGGDHILSHQYPGAGRDLETAPQDELAVDPLGEARRHTKLAGQLVADHHAAHGRRADDLDRVRTERRPDLGSQSLAQRSRPPRVQQQNGRTSAGEGEGDYGELPGDA